jgi:RNA polymerase sigma-70 factor (ECF subfamily)
LLANVRRRPTEDAAAELARVFEEHHRRVFRAAYRITGNATDAEDVMQSVFLRLAVQEPELGGVDNLGSYLHRAAINNALDLCRSRWRTGRVQVEEVVGASVPDATASAATEEVEIRVWLRRALAVLSPRQAEIFVLRYLEGYDNREIAQVLGTSAAVVAVSLFRARAQLQQQFRKLAGGTP